MGSTKVKKRLLFIVVICILGLTGPANSITGAAGEEPSGFRDVRLWVQPEYDDHRLLVMLQGEITGLQAPATVRFLVPSAAQMYSAGSINPGGIYSGGPPSRQVSAFLGWDEISYELTSSTFRVEYYDPNIIGDPEKTIAYQFRTLYPISEIEVRIQQPRSSSAFAISPPGQLFLDSEGFTAYSFHYPELTPDSPLNFDISYTKTDKRPSLAIPTGNNEGSSSTFAIVVLVGLVGVIAIVILLRRRKPARSPSKKRTTPSTVKKGKKGISTGKNWYCKECRKHINGSYSFCPFCGSKK